MTGTRRPIADRKTAGGLRTAILVVVFTTIGYIAATIAEHAPRQFVSSTFAVERPVTKSDALAGASAAGTSEPADYFPDHYVNQATRIEEQPASF